jgi:hypothetical protein
VQFMKLYTEDKNTENDDEEEAAVVWKPIPKHTEAFVCVCVCVCVCACIWPIH